MAESGRCLNVDGNISRDNAKRLSATGQVTFYKLKRRMVYELTNRSNSTTAADVYRPCAANRSRPDRSGPF
jgi:hypothetical protein